MRQVFHFDDDGSDVMEQMTDDDGPIASAFIIIQVSLFVIHRRHTVSS